MPPTLYDRETTARLERKLDALADAIRLLARLTAVTLGLVVGLYCLVFFWR